MCLYIKKGYKRHRIAEKCITVYKVVAYRSGIAKSKVQFFSYILGKTYKTTFRYDSSKSNIFDGFHAYLSLTEARMQRSNGYRVMECKIPKGAKYHIGEYNQIASDTIKPVRIIKLCAL